MSFYQKYELARLIADEETKTFRAIEIATGQSVLFHFFNSESRALLIALRAKLEPNPGKPQRPLLEVGEFAGNPYAVTEMIEPFTTFGDWLAVVEVREIGVIDQQNGSTSRVVTRLGEPRVVSASGSGQAPYVPAPPPVNPPAVKLTVSATPKPPEDQAAQGGEFTRFFDQPTPPPSAPASGDFTRWFESPSGPPGEQVPLKTEVRRPPTSQPQQDEFTKLFEAAPQTDEFEKLFGGNVSSRPFESPADKPFENAAGAGNLRNPFEDTLPQAAPRASGPGNGLDMREKPNWPANSSPSEDTGQFTKLFGSGPSGEAIDIEGEQARAAQAARPEGRPFQAASEFTRVFGHQGSGNSPNPPLPPKMGLESGIFGSAPKLETAVPAQKSGPGEYTRMTTLAELEAEHAALQQAKASEAAPPRKSRRNALMIGLAIGGAVLIVAIIVVLVMGQKH